MVKQNKQEGKIIHFDLNRSQKEAWNILFDNETNQLLLAGSAHSGKSYFGCYWIFYLANKYPGTRYLIGRTVLADLKKSTLVTLFKVFRDLGITEDYYNYNQQDNIITLLWNKSQIILKDLSPSTKDPEYSSMGSNEYSASYIDECNLVDVQAITAVLTRTRWMHQEFNLMPKLLMTCNPNKGWVYSDFYQPFHEGTLSKTKKFVQTYIEDNKDHTPDTYIEMLASQDNRNKKRLLDGDWEFDSDGLQLIQYGKILDMFIDEPNKNLIPRSNDYYISCDPARLGKDSTVITVWNGLNVVEIVQLNQVKVNITTGKIYELVEKYNVSPRNIIMDVDGLGSFVDFISGAKSFHNQSKPLYSENFRNLKSQCYFGLADKINAGEIKIYNCQEDIKSKLIQELAVLAPAQMTTEIKLEVISKDEIKSIIGRSPDISDCLMFRIYFSLMDKNSNKSFKIRVGNFNNKILSPLANRAGFDFPRQ